MSDATVTIIDYGCGNLLSVARALEAAGAKIQLSSNASEIRDSERLLLPGVGTFEEGMKGLRERGLIEPIRSYADSGRPMLGICLGMQMLASIGEEFGEHEGLGLIHGRVKELPTHDNNGIPQKIPHIGWGDISKSGQATWEGSVLQNTPVGTSVYLVHSYHFVPDDQAHQLAECCFGGHRIAAAVKHGSITGCQFHPEKSGNAGIEMLRMFLKM